MVYLELLVLVYLVFMNPSDQVVTLILCNYLKSF